MASFDGPPMDGQYPTGLWEPGEDLLDVQRFTISHDVSPGSYPLVVGLYRPDTGERLPVGDQPSRAVELTRLDVP